MEILEKILGGIARVKIMRLFLLSPETAFDLASVADRSKVVPHQARRELRVLEDVGLLKRKTVFKQIPKKRKVEGWTLNPIFTYLYELRQLVINTTLIKNSEIVRRLQKSGKMKLIIVAGIFLQNPDSRLDLFIVGDGIKKGSLENAVKVIESEIGKELRYVFFDTEEFRYRLSMYDKLIRDVLDFPHEKILNRLQIEG